MTYKPNAPAHTLNVNFLLVLLFIPQNKDKSLKTNILQVHQVLT